MSFFTHLETLADTKAAKEAKRLCDLSVVNRNLETLETAMDAIRDMDLQYPELDDDEDGEDDYERHMRFECRMGNFV